MEITIFYLERETEAQSLQFLTILRGQPWAKDSALGPSKLPGPPGKQHSTQECKHSHSSDGNTKRRNTRETLKTQIFILLFRFVSERLLWEWILSLFHEREFRGTYNFLTNLENYGHVLLMQRIRFLYFQTNIDNQVAACPASENCLSIWGKISAWF